MDLSHLDKKYFVDTETYNCPFCKRNNVPYLLESNTVFDWNIEKKCYSYLITCSSCKKTSLHWSWEEIREVRVTYENGNIVYNNCFSKEIDELDSQFFFHQPTSFFVLDNRIPERIRELITEAEKCRSANSLVGASACIRKAIYELLSLEDSIVKIEGQDKADYLKSVEKLEKKYPQVDPGLFSILKQIKELVSDLLHENSWEAWNSTRLLTLTELLKVILSEIYLREDEKKKISNYVNRLRGSLVENKISKLGPKTTSNKSINQKNM